MEKTNLFKKKYGILLDTETIMHESKTLVYDLAWMVIDNQGNILSRHNYIVDEVFNNFPAMFDSHFVTYDKYQTYQAMIQDRQVKFWNAYNIFRRLARTIVDCDISFITAYNLGFDLRALKETAQYFGAINPLETRADSLTSLTYGNYPNRTLQHDHIRNIVKYMTGSLKSASSLKRQQKLSIGGLPRMTTLLNRTLRLQTVRSK